MSEEKYKRIMVTATMSAGKSTLINALIGKEIMATSNSACTNNIVRIEESTEADDIISIKLNNYRARFKNYTPSMLLNTETDLLDIETSMKHHKDTCKWQIIDTPGINYSVDEKHQTITEKYLSEDNFDVLLIVLNGNHLGTNDERKYLEKINQCVASEKIIFVINKLDQYLRSNDSIKETNQNVEKYLERIGFKNPLIQPVSAKVGFLSKVKLNNKKLNEFYEEDLEFYQRKFKHDFYNLSSYNFFQHQESENKLENLLIKSGLKNLEIIIAGKEI